MYHEFILSDILNHQIQGKWLKSLLCSTVSSLVGVSQYQYHSSDVFLGSFVTWMNHWCTFGVILIAWALLGRFTSVPSFLHLWMMAFTLVCHNWWEIIYIWVQLVCLCLKNLETKCTLCCVSLLKHILYISFGKVVYAVFLSFTACPFLAWELLTGESLSIIPQFYYVLSELSLSYL